MARHPELKNYISNFLKSIKGDIEKRKITHLHVLICDQGGRKGGRGGRIVEEAVLEKFSFEIRPMMMHLHPKGGVGGGGSSSLSASVASKMRQELQLDLIQDSMRSLFQKILFCDSKLVPKNFLGKRWREMMMRQDNNLYPTPPTPQIPLSACLYRCRIKIDQRPLMR